MEWLRHRHWPANCSAVERTRLKRRTRLYTWADGELLRHMGDGSTRLIPRPEDRTARVLSTHHEAGHFGRRRTEHLVRLSCWWVGLQDTVKEVVKNCAPCGRVKAGFNGPSPILHPLPIEGLFYRWGVDLFGPFDTSNRGNVIVMVCVEHYSKWVEVVALPNRAAATCAAAFRQAVLGRFGACAEVITDQGGEWKGEFEALLRRSLIDHRTTSPDRPQADGLAERAVQTFKRCLRTLVEASGVLGTWDDELPYIQLGYNSACQASTKCSPMMLLYGRAPTVPPAVRERLETPLMEVGSKAEVAAAFLNRVLAIKAQGIIIGDNLKIAQHRDTLRYAKKRNGDYEPMIRKFEVGDYVYVRAHQAARKNLDSHTHHKVWRITRVGVAGTLTVQNPEGDMASVHSENAAPCHVPSEFFKVWVGNMPHGQDSMPCKGCGFANTVGPDMLICDACGLAWHLLCLTIPLLAVPLGAWRCDHCVSVNAPVELGQKAGQTRGRRTNAARRKAQASHPWEGRLAIHTTGRGKSKTSFWGIIHCRGTPEECRGRENFLVSFEDGFETTYTASQVSLLMQPANTIWPTGRTFPTRSIEPALYD